MKCYKCGKEIDMVLITMFTHEGYDVEIKVDLDDLGNGVYGADVSTEWTGYLVDEEEQVDTIMCPKCRQFPFKDKEIGVQEVVRLTFWGEVTEEQA